MLKVWIIALQIILFVNGNRINLDIFVTNETLFTKLKNIEDIIFGNISSLINIRYKFTESLSSNSIDLLVCNPNSSLFAIIIGNEADLSSFSTSLLKIGIIQITIPFVWKNDLKSTKSNFTFGIQHNSFASLFYQIIPDYVWKETIIFWDISSNLITLQTLMSMFSSMKIKSRLVNLQNETEENLKLFMKNHIKKKVRILILYSNNVLETLKILKLGINEEIFQSNYYWIIANVYIQFSDILNILDSKLNPNIAIIVPSALRLLENKCGFSICEKSVLLYQVYDSMDTIAQISENLLGELLDRPNACLNASQREVLRIAFERKEEKTKIWGNFISRNNLVDVYVTKSVDLTHSVPNVFTYSTDFVMSAIFNITDNKLVKQFTEIFMNDFKTWNNKTINICSPPIFPALTYTRKNSFVELNGTTGLIFEILSILSAKLNFIPLLYEAADSQWGARKNDSFNFTGCIGDIFNKKTLFGASLFTINAMRNEGVDFTAPFFEESNSALLRFSTSNSKIWNVFRPLHWSTWLMILVSTIFASYVSYILSCYSPLSAWNLKLSFTVLDEIRLREHIWNIVGSFLMQGQDFYPYSMSSRTVLAIWWIFTVVIFSTYTADLTSFLTVKTDEHYIHSLEELASRKDLKIIVEDGTSTAIFLQNSNYTVFKELYSRIQYIRAIDECPKLIMEGNSTHLVCIADTSSLTYVIRQFCSQIYIVPETFDSGNIGFPVQNDAPFKPLMDLYIRKMVDNGQIEKWINKYWSFSNYTNDGCGQSTNQDSAPSITLLDVAGIYVCTGIVIILSFTILFVEILWVKSYKKPLDNFMCQY